MIEFSCTYCGRRFRIAAESAGKKGTCPNCKKIVVVPESPTRLRAEDFDAGKPEPEVEGAKSPYNLTLLDVPGHIQERRQSASEETTDGPAEAYPEEFNSILPGHMIRDEEPPAERRLPWIIDIFLYPLSKSGIIILGMVVGVPLILAISIALCVVLAAAFAPALILLVFAWVLLVMSGFVLDLYIIWYLFRCIEDSALGGLRAPETAGVTPGLGELLWQPLRILICVVLFMLPAILYCGNVQRIDGVFLGLLACGVFLLPMSLLVLAMFDSLASALNPILLAGSILSTLLPYLGLFIIITLTSIPAALLIRLLPLNSFTFFIDEAFVLYAALMVAHLIGCFYRRYQEKLNWEV